MGFIINLVGSIFLLMFKFYFWAAAIAIIAIIYLCRWLYRLTTQNDESSLQTDNYDYDDGSKHCTLGYTDEEQFCVNCDLVEQCRGIPSPREKKHDEHDVISDFFMFNHLLDLDDKHDEKEHHVHDSFNCDDAWCECHEDDGYSWFDENGDDDDSCL